ncbi:hypothetical protein BDN70DRAFT_889633 [Pholiota conissans]|uniref:Uncharacterized protein n=1 Tax=Pholiota conissans TaxID=109636 RepID=A0A9P5ZDX0_9AGAR|nr:hypothetical protein BDN70DRAFT_889633 [Pholiota conissans]
MILLFGGYHIHLSFPVNGAGTVRTRMVAFTYHLSSLVGVGVSESSLKMGKNSLLLFNYARFGLRPRNAGTSSTLSNMDRSLAAPIFVFNIELSTALVEEEEGTRFNLVTVDSDPSGKSRTLNLDIPNNALPRLDNRSWSHVDFISFLPPKAFDVSTLPAADVEDVVFPKTREYDTHLSTLYSNSTFHLPKTFVLLIGVSMPINYVNCGENLGLQTPEE